MNATGGCLCGQTRYEINGPLESCDNCHCIDCRRSAGASPVAWGTVRRHAFIVTRGEIRIVEYAERLRGFAACCGTHLSFARSRDADTIDFTLASLDDPAAFRPRAHIWTEDKLPWVHLEPDLPAYPQSHV
jgi:hypothetical protein